MTARDTIFQGIRDALAPLKDRAAYPGFPPSATDPVWLADESDPPTLFHKRLTATGAKFFADATACARWLREDGAQLVYLAPALADLAPIFAAELAVTHEYSRARVDEIDAAVTPAAGAIAESGTIILTDGDMPDRLAALAPWRHIAAVPSAKLYRTIPDAIAAFPPDPNIIWVTGPSKTADVEGILIQGVHGPGQQGCFFV
jgi:L-lactate dehydrogenase complex protein LldG